MNAGRRQGAWRHRGERRSAALPDFPWVTAAVALAALLVHACPPLAGALELDRAALARGEAWRLVTGHLVHFSAEHLVLDVLAFLALGLACERRAPRLTRAALGAAALAVSAGVLALSPAIARYRGLSGLDATLCAVLATTVLAPGGQDRGKAALPARVHLAAALLGAAFLGKLGFELAAGRALFVDSAAAGFVPLPLAHLLGAGTGLAAVLCSMRQRSGAVGLRPPAQEGARPGLRTRL